VPDDIGVGIDEPNVLTVEALGVNARRVDDEVMLVDDDVNDSFALPTVANELIGAPADVEVGADSLDKTEFI